MLLAFNELQYKLKLLKLFFWVVVKFPEVRQGLFEIDYSKAASIEIKKRDLILICNTVK